MRWTNATSGGRSWNPGQDMSGKVAHMVTLPNPPSFHTEPQRLLYLLHHPFLMLNPSNRLLSGPICAELRWHRIRPVSFTYSCAVLCKLGCLETYCICVRAYPRCWEWYIILWKWEQDLEVFSESYICFSSHLPQSRLSSETRTVCSVNLVKWGARKIRMVIHKHVPQLEPPLRGHKLISHGKANGSHPRKSGWPL